MTDAVVLSPLVSGTVFVIGSEMTRRPQAARAIEIAHGQRRSTARRRPQPRGPQAQRYYYSRYYGYKNRNYYFTSPAA